MSTFPHEIYDCFIDYLHRDRAALGNCALVCSAWTASSRFHLFRAVELRLENAARDLAILRAPLATVPRHIQDLCIDASDDVEMDPATMDHLVLGLPPMKQLRTLRLQEVVYQLSHSAKANLFQLLKQVSSLQLKNVYFTKSEMQLELISAAWSLEALSLSAIAYGKGGASPASIYRAPAIKQLQVFDTQSWHAKQPTTSSILDWLALDSQPKAVRTLELRGITVSNIPAICTYVHMLEDSLQNIVIECSQASAQDALGRELDLTRFTSLKTIVFHTPTDVVQRFAQMKSTWIQRILSRISSDCVHSVSFKLYFCTAIDLSMFDMCAVGKIFAGGVSCLSTSTTKLRFEIASRCSVGLDELREAIIMHFPNLAGRLEFGRGVAV